MEKRQCWFQTNFDRIFNDTRKEKIGEWAYMMMPIENEITVGKIRILPNIFTIGRLCQIIQLFFV